MQKHGLVMKSWSYVRAYAAIAIPEQGVKGRETCKILFSFKTGMILQFSLILVQNYILCFDFGVLLPAYGSFQQKAEWLKLVQNKFLSQPLFICIHR